MFPTGTLSFQVLQPIRSTKDTSASIDTITQVLGKIGDRYSFKKKPESQHENTTSSESSANKGMEVMMAGKNESSTQNQNDNITDEDGLMELFGQSSCLMSPMSD